MYHMDRELLAYELLMHPLARLGGEADASADRQALVPSRVTCTTRACSH